MFEAIGRGVSDIRASFAKRKLQGELKSTIDIMEGHKELNLPAKHPFYSALDKRAHELMVDYQKSMVALGKPKPDMFLIMMGAPKLRELQSLASGNPLKTSVSPVHIGVGVVTMGALVTVVMAGYHDLYLLLTHTANFHWR